MKRNKKKKEKDIFTSLEVRSGEPMVHTNMHDMYKKFNGKKKKNFFFYLSIQRAKIVCIFIIYVPTISQTD